jgi:phosphoribosylamine--glycine ligase
MTTLLIGSGGREHALAYALKKSESCKYLYCSPGNPGIFELAVNAQIDVNDYLAVAEFCKDKKVDLVVIGPEQPLAEGLSDFLRERGINVFGPSKAAAQLESSKGFAKEFMKRHRIPTAKYARFSASEAENAHEYIENHKMPIVLKADGLAAGKGVIVAQTNDEAHAALDEMFAGKFKDAGKEVVIEDFLEGEEASILAITDGQDFFLMPPSQDHKRVFDGDKGENTGGMGAYAPAPIVSDLLLKKIEEKVIKPAIRGMAGNGTPFIGCLYAGLMINDGEPYVVEFNVRFGDPETQPVMMLFNGDFAKLLYSAAIGSLDRSAASIVENEYTCCVVLASDGYPGSYQKGMEIKGIENIDSETTYVFHAGTSKKGGKLLSAGGRVLGVTSRGKTLKDAIDNAYSEVAKISFENMYYRKDIGRKGLK